MSMALPEIKKKPFSRRKQASGHQVPKQATVSNTSSSQSLFSAAPNSAGITHREEAKKARARLLPPSVARIDGVDVTLEFRGFPAALQFDLGGRLGNIVTRSRTVEVLKGWRVVGVDGEICPSPQVGGAIASAQQKSRKFKVTFRYGDTAAVNVVEDGAVLKQEIDAEKEEDATCLTVNAVTDDDNEVPENPKGEEAMEVAAAEGQKELAAAEKQKELAATKIIEFLKIQSKKRRAFGLEVATSAAGAEARKAEAKARAEATARVMAEQEEKARREAAEKEAAEAKKRAAEAKAAQKARAQAAAEAVEVKNKSAALESALGLPKRATVKDTNLVLLSALGKSTTKPVVSPAIAKPKLQGPCDKCDGPHHESACPYFSKARDAHTDAIDMYEKRKKKRTASGPHGSALEEDDDDDEEGGDESVVLAASHVRVVKQPGDGSCLFHSLAFGLRGLPSDGGGGGGGGAVDASRLRAELEDYIAAHPHQEISGTPIETWVMWDSQASVEAYTRRMRNSSDWGGAIEIAACAVLRGVEVHVFEYERSTASYVRISCFVPDSKSESLSATAGPSPSRISVLYGGRCHYDAIEVR